MWKPKKIDTIYVSKNPQVGKEPEVKQLSVGRPFGWNLRSLECHGHDGVRDETGRPEYAK